MPGYVLLLKLLACGFFGVATSLLVVAAYRVTRGGEENSKYAGVSMRRAEMRRRALAKGGAFKVFLPVIQAVAGLVERISPEVLRSYVRLPYAKAGIPGGLEDDEVVAIGLMLSVGIMFVIGFCASVFFGFAMTWTALVGLPLGFLLVVSVLKARAKAREMEILQALPYVLDLLVLILRSGTSLNIALNRVVEDYLEHPIGDELGQVLAEVNMGSLRTAAFRAFAERIDTPDVIALADSIVQSEELGWPLAETLERLADRLQTERVLRAQSTAGSAGVLVMAPTVLVMAAAVLLLFGPIIVKMMRNGYSIQ